MCYQYGYGGAYGWRGRYLSNQAPVNISETEDRFTIKLYAPDLDKQRISLTTQNDILYIRYEGDERQPVNFKRREYRTEEIDRSFDLKGKVNTEAITASYSEGVLTVVLPKNETAMLPSRQVNIS